MRLWHKDILTVLPRQQLISQWRECCCIARNIAVNGTPNHILVNKVLDYPVSDFMNYCRAVTGVMISRGYKISAESQDKFMSNMTKAMDHFNNDRVTNEVFEGWHNDRYFLQCYVNLMEKYDCGGITEEEWSRLTRYFSYKKLLT